MKKLLLITTTIGTVLAFTLVSAEEVRPTRAAKTLVPMRASVNQGTQEGMPKLEIPRTGDAVVDKQIADLVKEREEKIKANNKIILFLCITIPYNQI